ncbi:hypothetical protein O6H91_02G153300 [Diphasiastrum complanatum]|uniref:Uncharacterized protein n=1 Tax=Diphasiastrum complanatum TaxID=34168 RepID=A0ACC2EM62_DIPCM|nr:hypothetical protein O6H91_02G153300 [Diphasiastrum complanatum]
MLLYILQATVDNLKQAIHKKSSSKFYPLRQRLTLPLQPGQEKATVLESSKRLKDYSDKNASKDEFLVIFKDLGPQVWYRTLFFWEYFGPLVIYPIFFYIPSLYRSLLSLPPRTATHPVQKLALCFWTLHYTKRILETFFVHNFSHASSPVRILFKNCLYYWPFAAIISYSINHPSYVPVGKKQMYVGFAFGLVNEASNLYCHLILKGLRFKDGKGGYQIPSNFLFDFITCANYTTEIYAWLGFNVATQTIPGYAFMLWGAYTMSKWALGKHRRLEKLFDGKQGRQKYPNRWVMLPPFL